MFFVTKQNRCVFNNSSRFLLLTRPLFKCKAQSYFNQVGENNKIHLNQSGNQQEIFRVNVSSDNFKGNNYIGTKKRGRYEKLRINLYLSYICSWHALVAHSLNSLKSTSFGDPLRGVVLQLCIMGNTSKKKSYLQSYPREQADTNTAWHRWICSHETVNEIGPLLWTLLRI